MKIRHWLFAAWCLFCIAVGVDLAQDAHAVQQNGMLALWVTCILLALFPVAIFHGLRFLYRRMGKHSSNSTNTKTLSINSSSSSLSSATSDSYARMSDEAYQGFRQLVKMALSDDVVEHDEAAYLYAYLRKEGGLQDSRTHHLAIAFAATLNDGIFDEDEAEEMRVLLSEFADADLFSAPQEKKAASSHKAHKSKAKKSKKRARPALGDIEAGGTYDLTYCDADGNYSERRVHVREIAFNKSGNEIVKGRCHLAKATRSFRRDRIISAIDIATGEICA